MTRYIASVAGAAREDVFMLSRERREDARGRGELDFSPEPIASASDSPHSVGVTRPLERKPYASRIGFCITEKCNIRCRHCIADCGPSRTETITWSLLGRAIREATSLGTVTTISMTGGEPFLEFSLLRQAVELCRSLGVKATVATNGYWAGTVARARDSLRQLSGLTHLGLSTDSFHQEFIPVASIRNAIVAGTQLGIDVSVAVSYLDTPAEEIEEVHRQLADVAGLYETMAQPVIPGGRACSEIDRKRLFRWDVGKSDCMSADVPSVQTSGTVTACCGMSNDWPGDSLLRLGDIEQDSLGDIIIEADRTPVLHAIRLWGPAGLAKVAAERASREGRTFAIPEGLGMCELCEYLSTDPDRASLIREAVSDPAIVREIAVARLVELGEASMLAGLD